MRSSTLTLLAAASPVLADDILGSLLNSITNLGRSAVEILQTEFNAAPQTNPPFNAKDQFVDVSGVHAWKAPGPNDARGPCPGLNALANHGFLNRNGYSDIVQLTSAVSEVFGMGIDLAAVLAAYGAALDGSGVGWSIGGEQHTGIGGSRGNYESDSSPFRGDLDVWGSNTNMVMPYFKDFFSMQPDPATANYDMNVITQFRGRRFNQSVMGNPNFYYSPFAGIAVSQAAFSFVFRLMANHSETHPAGRLDQEVLKSFFAVEGDGDNMKWRPGYERIPDNWYKRAFNDAYGVRQLGYDQANILKAVPLASKPGCNRGTVNSYVQVNQSDLDTSHYDFSKPNAALCYGLAAVNQDQRVIGAVGDAIAEVVQQFQDGLNCTTVPSLNQTIGDTCPGATLYGGPTGPIAKGANQNA